MQRHLTAISDRPRQIWVFPWGTISGCDNGQNVWTHANGLWEQELSQNMRNGPDTERLVHVREKSACSLCGAATGGRLNLVPIMTRIKAQNRVWEKLSGPLLSLSQTFLQPLSVSFLSISRLNLLMFLSNSCAFFLSSPQALFPLNSCLSHSSRHELSPNAWNQPAGASERAREGEKRTLRLQMTAK